jgi:hypothetical protein
VTIITRRMRDKDLDALTPSAFLSEIGKESKHPAWATIFRVIG